MSQIPCFPLWTDAYLGDTGHLTTLEHGAYLLLLIAMWRTEDCTLPDDDKMLARYCHLTLDKWRKIAPVVRSFLRPASAGKLMQPRAKDEFGYAKNRAMAQSKRVKARWLKTKEIGYTVVMPDAAVGNTNPFPTPFPTPGSSYEEPSLTPKVVRQVRGLVNGEKIAFDLWYPHYPHKVGKGAAVKAFPGALAKAGSVDVLIEATERYKQTKPFDQSWCHPASWLNGERWLDEPAVTGAPTIDFSKL